MEQGQYPCYSDILLGIFFFYTSMDNETQQNQGLKLSGWQFFKLLVRLRSIPELWFFIFTTYAETLLKAEYNLLY